MRYEILKKRGGFDRRLFIREGTTPLNSLYYKVLAAYQVETPEKAGQRYLDSHSLGRRARLLFRGGGLYELLF